MNAMTFPRIRGKQARAIVQAITANPARTSLQIAEEVGAHHEYVRTVARRYGLEYGTRKNSKALGEENEAWLRQQAKAARTTRAEMLRAIVTDARLDDAEEAQNEEATQ